MQRLEEDLLAAQLAGGGDADVGHSGGGGGVGGGDRGAGAAHLSAAFARDSDGVPGLRLLPCWRAVCVMSSRAYSEVGLGVNWELSGCPLAGSGRSCQLLFW